MSRGVFSRPGPYLAIQITYEGFTPPGTDIGWRGKPYILTEASIKMVISGPNKRPWQISLKPGETKGIYGKDLFTPDLINTYYCQQDRSEIFCRGS
jgi:hypothetical protein